MSLIPRYCVIYDTIGIHCGYAIRSGRHPEGSQRPPGRPHIRCWIKNNCANCALKWEIQWFDHELFIHTCMMSPAKRADVTCQVKPEDRRPDPLLNIPRTGPAHKQPEYKYGFIPYLVMKKIATKSPVYCRLTPCFHRHFAMFGDSSQVRACCSNVQTNG